MIDPYVLRLGNLFRLENHSLQPGHGWQLVTSIDMMGVNLIQTDLGIQRTLFSQIEGIPITPDILAMNCGFQQTQVGSMAHPDIYAIHYRKGMINRRLHLQYYSDYFQWIEGNDIIDLKDLHELQNFYHWLTETELFVSY